MLINLPAAQRLIVVQNIGDASQGDSLAGQNVGLYPAGVLAYVANSNRFYRLRKNLNTLVLPDSSQYRNVVAAVGSSSEEGYWVAVEQIGQVTLATTGVATLIGFDLTTPGFFLTSIITPGGTIGQSHVTPATVASATVQSSSTSDTSTVGVVYIQGASSF